MVKIIHIADTHLGFRLRSNYKKDWLKEGEIRWYENDFYKKWAEILEYCIENKDDIDFIVHSGDLFDTPYGDHNYPPPEPAREAVMRGLKEFFELTNNEIPVILIDGNHGVYQGYRYSIMDSITTMFPNVYYFSVWDLRGAISENEPLICEFQNKNLRFYLFPYFEFAITEDLNILYNEWIEKQRPKEDVIEVAVVHGSEIDNTLHNKIKSFNYSYVALGHEHSQRKVSNKLYYSGSFAPINFDEEDITHGFIEIDIEYKKNPIIQMHTYDKQREMKVIEIEVDPSITSSSIVKKITEELEPYKTETWDGNTAARLKINFKGNIPLKNFWGLSDELNSLNAKIINEGMYNILQLILNWQEVSKHLDDEMAPEIVEEYILSNPREEFLEYLKGKIKPDEGFDFDLLAEIAIEAIEIALKKIEGDKK